MAQKKKLEQWQFDENVRMIRQQGGTKEDVNAYTNMVDIVPGEKKRGILAEMTLGLGETVLEPLVTTVGLGARAVAGTGELLGVEGAGEARERVEQKLEEGVNIGPLQFPGSTLPDVGAEGSSGMGSFLRERIGRTGASASVIAQPVPARRAIGAALGRAKGEVARAVGGHATLGGMALGGEELGAEGGTTAGRVASMAGAGVLLGGTLGLIAPSSIGTVMAARSGKRAYSQAMDSFRKIKGDDAADALIDKTVENFRGGFFSAGNRELKKEVAERTSFLQKFHPKEDINSDSIIKEIVSDGYLPFVRKDGTASFRWVREDIRDRINLLSDGIRSVLSRPDIAARRTSLSDLQKSMEVAIRSDKQIGSRLPKALQELKQTISGLREKYKDQVVTVRRGGRNVKEVQLTPRQLLELSKEMNALTGAPVAEPFLRHSYNVIGREARNKLDELVPDHMVNDANAAISKLSRMREVTDMMDERMIDVGPLGQAMGRFAGAYALGLTGISLGHGSLVIAGLAALMGGRLFANVIRQLNFNDPKRINLLKSASRDRDLLKRILEQSSPEDRTMLETEFARVMRPDPRRDLGEGLGAVEQKALNSLGI